MWITEVPAQHILTMENVAPLLLELFVKEKGKGLLPKKYQAVYNAISSKVNTTTDHESLDLTS